jgi:hypothetical protein
MVACGGPTVYCPAGSSSPLVVPAGSFGVFVAGASSSTQSSVATCAAGSYCVGGVSTACLAGRYGNTSALTSAACTGLCPAGYVRCVTLLVVCSLFVHCPRVYDARMYCPQGTSTPTLRCGNATVYCPTGSVSPLYVGSGSYSTGGVDATVQTQQNVCELGWFCDAGTRLQCSAGRYGNTTGLTTTNCSGLCPAGYVWFILLVPLLFPQRLTHGRHCWEEG